MLPRRLRRLPEQRLPGGLRVFSACPLRARLLGLALLDHVPADCALLIPACSCVHTFGMRFPLDLVFLDREGRAVRIERRVAPRRFVRCRAAAAVLEAPSSAPASWTWSGFLDVERLLGRGAAPWTWRRFLNATSAYSAPTSFASRMPSASSARSSVTLS